MRPTLGTSRPQRQVLYSASKGVNSSVGLSFFVATYRNDFISVGGHKKNTELQKNWNISVFFCSHSVFPTKTTYGNLFNFAFLESHSGWPNTLLTRLSLFSFRAVFRWSSSMAIDSLVRFKCTERRLLSIFRGSQLNHMWGFYSNSQCSHLLINVSSKSQCCVLRRLGCVALRFLFYLYYFFR